MANICDDTTVHVTVLGTVDRFLSEEAKKLYNAPVIKTEDTIVCNGQLAYKSPDNPNVYNLVRYFGFTIAGDVVTQKECQQMADMINYLVDMDLIGHALLLQPFSVKLGMLNKTVIHCYAGSKFEGTVDELNDLAGVNWFVKDGEIAPSDPTEVFGFDIVTQ